MPQSWSFSSFASEGYSRVFGSGNALYKADFRELVAIEDFGCARLPGSDMLAARLIDKGIDYNGLAPEEQDTLDELVKLAFTAEGFAAVLELKPESPDFLPQSVINELLERASGRVTVRLLPILKTGRRVNQPLGPECGYFTLAPEEVLTLKSEVDGLLSMTIEWRSEEMQEWIQANLAAVLDSVAGRDRMLYGQLG